MKHHHNTTGNIPTEHRFDALDGFREAAEPDAYVRVEWPHRGGWVEFSDVERIRVSITGAIHVTATVTRTPALGNLYREGDRFTGWIDTGHDLSIWQAIEVTPENVDGVF
mgnify:CR=1 FL=1